MKLSSSKPISSPGRAEKYYPPPLMRFIRSNVGSRSRKSSRSSPMFVRKRNTAIETQEPSSPKVTCMGQVRVRRSKQAKTRPGKPRRHCKWIRKALFFHCLTGRRLKPKCSKPSFRKWVLFFQASFHRRSEVREGSSKKDSKFGCRNEDLEQGSEEVKNENEEEDDNDDEDEASDFASTPISPPKNALLLTRCRSAPYRSSSLASRFWGSPLKSEETEQKQCTEQESTEDDCPTSKRECFSRESDNDSTLDPEREEKLGFFREFEGSITSIKERIIMKPEKKIEELNKEEEEGDVTARPLILTRCKSEPARVAEKLDPEISFWKERRLGIT